MAAILCQSASQACSGFCDMLGNVLCLPCKACGMACNGIGDLLSSPFFPYTALTFGLNVPPIVLGIQGMMKTDCWNIDKWFLVNAALCVVHCGACLYIIHRIQHDPGFVEDPVVAAMPVEDGGKRQSLTASVFGGSKTEAPQDAGTEKKSFTASVFGGSSTSKPGAYPSAPQEDPAPKKSFTSSVFGSKTDESKIEAGTYYAQPARAQAVVTKSTHKSILDSRSNSMSRIKHVLCYDGGVAIYIIFAIIWMVWQGIGFSRLMSFSAGDCGGNAVASKLVTSLLCGYIYMSLVGIGFLCSLCCLR